MTRITLIVKRLTWAALGFTVGGIALYILGSGGPPLEPWHTEELEEEFTTEKAAEIRTFDDYRRLEDKLFAELEKKVYTRTGTGPAYALVRYSAGSASDPNRWDHNWNRSFEFPAETPVGGALLLHGMSDGPYSLRALAETLSQRSYWVVSLRLPGHGTAPSGLTRIKWEDMAAAVRLGMEHLESKVGQKPVHIIGYSTGAPLALNFSLNAIEGRVSPVPASLVLLSPAIAISPAAALAKWKNRLALLPGLERLAWTQILPEFDPFRYNSFTSNAGDQVHRLTRSVAKRITAQSASQSLENFPPTLVLLSTVDATVSTNAVVDRLLGHLAPNRHELVLFDINRSAVKSTLLVSDPGPLTNRLMADGTLPFAVTLVTNENSGSIAVVARRKAPFSTEASRVEPLDLGWPRGVISLSHVALPFPPDDPLYGARPPGNEGVIFLGQTAILGERGLLKLPSNWLLRLRRNPFYAFLETRVLEWVDDAAGKTAMSTTEDDGAD